MKQKLSYVLFFATITLFSCTQETTSKDVEANEQTSSQNKNMDESQVDGNDSQPVSEAFLITCNHIGSFGFICQNYDGILSKFNKKDVSEIEEDMMEGLYTTIKMGKDELKVFLDDNKTILSAVVTSSNFATKEGIRTKMTLSEIEAKFGKPVPCQYMDEVGMVTIELSGKDGCIIAKLDTKVKNKHISEILPSSLKKKENFLSNAPELKNLDLYLSEIIVLAK
jgi:hypothetical protein